MLGFFILLIVIFFFVIPAIRVAVTVHRVRKRTRQFFDNARQAAEGGANRSSTKERKPGWSEPTPHNKVYRPADGEYVEWEEVTITHTETSQTTDNQGNTHLRVDSQVIDVEWEDVNTGKK